MISTHSSTCFTATRSAIPRAVVDSGKRQVSADALDQKMKRRMMNQPAPFHSFVQTLVLAKSARMNVRGSF
jgi:hypothetical protein